ncbi:MAG: RNA 3'-terminal phosphate cyclase [Desulfobacteraceae bacterium]|jgi:RNA 3'-terminal phosphate cyclase (ATP)
MLQIDGAQGEGGGQVLRSALALSLVTGQAFEIRRIRAGRQRPGLMRQHAAAVHAATAVGSARVAGGTIGSQQLTFVPEAVKPGDFRFAVGSAGSATLVLQAVLPALVLAGGPSTVVLEGGTHNPFAPPFDFLEKAFLPLLGRMGPQVTVALDRPGFFPAGGGRFTARVTPVARLRPLVLTERGKLLRLRGAAIVADLPRRIAEREAAALADLLPLAAEDVAIRECPGCGPGNAVLVAVHSEHVSEVFSAFGARGRPAESVARAAAEEVLGYLAAGVPVGRRLADQLLLPMALAGGGSFHTLEPSRHTRTNIAVIGHFLGAAITARPLEQGAWQIAVTPGPAFPSADTA